MSNKVCFEYYSVVHCICTNCLTGRLSALYLVVPADGKLQTLWNWFSSPTLLSLCEFILLVSTKGLSLHNSFLSKHFIFRKCVFFFCIRRPCRLTTSESNGAAEKWLPPWQAQRPWSNISTFFFVNLFGWADMLCCCFITTIMTNLHHIMLKQSAYPPFKQQDTCHVTLYIYIHWWMCSLLTAEYIFLTF